jgi:gamma-glutamyl:cysteine ligase YbdK (ATP-grasp superfamily)
LKEDIVLVKNYGLRNFLAPAKTIALQFVSASLFRTYNEKTIKAGVIEINSAHDCEYGYRGNRVNARDGNQPALNGQIVKQMLFPLPPLAEQHRIVAKVQQLQQQLSQLEAQVQQSRQYAQQLLQSVLKEVFEEKGKVYEMEEERAWMVAEE